jgi:pimeloyl-ACP methyl ester carboxylesterase
MSVTVQALEIAYRGNQARIEYQWVGVADAPGPVIVLLHEGLGSLAMWKDFPQRLCQRLQRRGLVYSLPGYGQSRESGAAQPWRSDFMHRQAHDVLPALLRALNVKEAPVLLGHSDGASIALLYAARYPHHCRAVIAIAPHLFVEAKTLSAIAALQAPALREPLLVRLNKYHYDARQVLDAWSQAWLAPEFATWSITDTIARMRCPVLGIQGLDDAYGTMQQIYALRSSAGPVQRLELSDCGHSPHRDQAEALSAAVNDFLTCIKGD